MYIESVEDSLSPHLFGQQGFAVTDISQILQIKEAGITHVIVSDGVEWRSGGRSSAAVAEHPAADPHNNLEDKTVSAPVTETPRLHAAQHEDMAAEVRRARRVCAEAKEFVLSMFHDVRLGKAIDPETTVPLVRQIADSVDRNPSALISVARLKTHDSYTYLHSVAVCALMVGLARQLGLDEDMVQLAGAGGLMHDLGKATVPLDILNKPGRLTDAEFAHMKRHSVAGGSMLKEAGAPVEVQDIALYHHEKFSGGGYPVGLVGNDIPLLARMGAVCDVYDAVTSERAYKRPWSPAEAIREMANWRGHFDERIFSAFVKFVGIYPVGSLVRLSSNELALVTEQGKGLLTKPIVRAFYSITADRTVPDNLIDLAAEGCTLRILGPEDPRKWGFHHLDTLWQ